MIATWKAMGCLPAHASEAPTSEVSSTLVTLDVSAPWSIAEESDSVIAIRESNGAHGIRVFLQPGEQGWRTGVTPVRSGTTLSTPSDPIRVPLFSFPYHEDKLSKLEILSEGPDLVVRAYGPPLDSMTDHSGATQDPVLTWIRIRRRGIHWRFIVQGLVGVTLSGGPHRVDHHPAGGTRIQTESWGTFQWTSAAPAKRAHMSAEIWHVDTFPSIEVAQPYPNSTLQWTP